MTEEERYEQICKPWMDRMEKETKETTHEILSILKGKNGDPGLVDNVRSIMHARAGWGKLGWLVAGAMVVQIVVLLFSFFKAGGN